MILIVHVLCDFIRIRQIFVDITSITTLGRGARLVSLIYARMYCFCIESLYIQDFSSYDITEEYFYLEQDEMVDVYSLGNVYYAMLTRKYPFQGEKPKKAIQKVKDGKRAPLPDDVANSNDKSIIALIKAMELSQAQNSNERPSATELVQLLVDALHEITK